jgi:hypothetical protein
LPQHILDSVGEGCKYGDSMRKHGMSQITVIGSGKTGSSGSLSVCASLDIRRGRCGHSFSPNPVAVAAWTVSTSVHWPPIVSETSLAIAPSLVTEGPM